MTADYPKRQEQTGRRGRVKIQRPAVGRTRDTHRTFKVAEVVALEIVRDIVAQNLERGDPLTSEIEMQANYQVSRSSLREAMRLLEVQGLIMIRPGPGASTTVGHAHPSNLARTVMLYLHLDGATYWHLLEAWIETAPLLAKCAALNPDRARVRTLLEPFLLRPGLGGQDILASAGVAFHDTVALLAGNPVLRLLLNAIDQIVTEYSVDVMQRHVLSSELASEHHTLAEAIMVGDGDLAAALMQRHIQNVIASFDHWPTLVGERVALP